ncbi:hypothetical protein Y1Q_0009336 [Alligator mississippiensis]|uniref:Uncharacterized protein n=1 Tax=Alligator mississippiensis TaxID=8496 RepID=A0A151N7E1_ALLMI|nr:hypothetical protein Y1Q_0009336 [Alligator mississippiensis]
MGSYSAADIRSSAKPRKRDFKDRTGIALDRGEGTVAFLSSAVHAPPAQKRLSQPVFNRLPSCANTSL